MTPEQFVSIQGQLYSIQGFAAVLVALALGRGWLSWACWAISIAFSVLVIFPGLRP